MAIPNIFSDYIVGGSMAANIDGNTVDLREYVAFAFGATWTATGSPVGDFTLEISNDATTWETLTGTLIPAGATSGHHLWDVSDLRVRYARFKYTFDSAGTGATVAVTLMIKSGS